MKLIPFLLSMIVTLVFIVSICLVIICCFRKRVHLINKSMDELLYVIFLFLPIVIFTLLMKLIPQSPSLCALIWVTIFAIFNRFVLAKLSGKNIESDTRLTLAFFAMFFSVIFFLIQGIKDGVEYFKMADTVLALIIGFYVSLETVLSDQTFFKKLKSIFYSIKLFKDETEEHDKKKGGKIKLSKTTIILLILFIVFIFCGSMIDGFEIYVKNEISILLGFVAGYFVALFSVLLVVKKKANYIKDCNDTRSEIFEQQKFKDYIRQVEDTLKFSNHEKYDCVEAFMFYKAFTSSLPNKELIEADSLMTVCNYIQKEYSYFKVSSVLLASSKNENRYILRKGKSWYCGDIMTSPWPLFKKYLRTHSGIFLENGNVPKVDRDRYKQSGYNRNIELWLLYFLEKYHGLSTKKKREIIPKEVRSFLANAYRLGAIWAIPSGCNKEKMRYEKREPGKKDKYDFGDLMLNAIFEWFGMCKDKPNEARKKLMILFSNKESAADKCEKWLREFKNWRDFVVENNLEVMVKTRGKGVFGKKYLEPHLFFEGHSYEKLLPETKEEWLKMFKKIAKLTYLRS